MNNVIIELALVIASMQRTIEAQNIQLAELRINKANQEVPF